MSERQKPKGPYTLWQDYGCYENWGFEDFPTLQAALEAPKNASDWHISKPVSYAISDTTESVTAPGSTP